MVTAPTQAILITDDEIREPKKGIGTFTAIPPPRRRADENTITIPKNKMVASNDGSPSVTARPQNTQLRKLLKKHLLSALALAAVIGAFGLIPLYKLNLWIASPAHISPTERISIERWWTAHSLANKALAIEEGRAQGDLIHSWRMALHEQPLCVDYHREFLKALLTDDHDGTERKAAVHTIRHLLLLSQTNQVDLELAISVLDRYRMDHEKLNLLQGIPSPRPPAMEEQYLATLLVDNQWERLRAALQSTTLSTQPNSKISLYKTAIRLADPTTPKCPALKQRLEAATAFESNADLALRLLLAVTERNNNSEGYKRTLGRLIKRFQDRPKDHTRYWRLLNRVGQKVEARTHALAYTCNPRTSDELADLAIAYREIGLNDLAYHVLENYVEEFEDRTLSRALQAEILTQQQFWRRLEKLALRIRSHDSRYSENISYSYFLQGLALHNLEKPEQARQAFERINQFSMKGSLFSYDVAQRLHELNHPRIALELLIPERQRSRNETKYWNLIFQTSRSLRSASRMLVAAENLMRLDDTNQLHIRKYTTALCYRIDHGSEALKAITAACKQFPTDTVLQLNLASALIRDSHLLQAAAVLAKINQTELDPLDQSRFSLARMALEFRNRVFPEARTIAAAIDSEKLLPQDRILFRAMLRALRST